METATTFGPGRLKPVADRLKMAAEPSRLAVFLMLDGGAEANVSQITLVLGCTQPATSHHLRLLKHIGFVKERRDGKFIYYSLTDTGRALLEVVRPYAAEEPS